MNLNCWNSLINNLNQVRKNLFKQTKTLQDVVDEFSSSFNPLQLGKFLVVLDRVARDIIQSYLFRKGIEKSSELAVYGVIPLWRKKTEYWNRVVHWLAIMFIGRRLKWLRFADGIEWWSGWERRSWWRNYRIWKSQSKWIQSDICFYSAAKEETEGITYKTDKKNSRFWKNISQKLLRLLFYGGMILVKLWRDVLDEWLIHQYRNFCPPTYNSKFKYFIISLTYDFSCVKIFWAWM